MNWLTHTHDLALVAETYAPPMRTGYMSGTSMEVFERTVHGCTTLVWKRSDPACDKVVIRVTMGKRSAE